jgi:hypothetical protein
LKIEADLDVSRRVSLGACRSRSTTEIWIVCTQKHGFGSRQARPRSPLIWEINGHEKAGCSAVQFFDEHHCAFGIHTTNQKQAQLQKAQPSKSSKIPLTSASFVVRVESFNPPLGQ